MQDIKLAAGLAAVILLMSAAAVSVYSLFERPAEPFKPSGWELPCREVDGGTWLCKGPPVFVGIDGG